MDKSVFHPFQTGIAPNQRARKDGRLVLMRLGANQEPGFGVHAAATISDCDTMRFVDTVV